MTDCQTVNDQMTITKDTKSAKDSELGSLDAIVPPDVVKVGKSPDLHTRQYGVSSVFIGESHSLNLDKRRLLRARWMDVARSTPLSQQESGRFLRVSIWGR